MMEKSGCFTSWFFFCIVVGLAVWGAVGYIILHFALKYW